MNPDSDAAWDILAKWFVSGLKEEWLSRMPEGLIFELSLPNDDRPGRSKLRIERVPESDTEAHGMAYDRHDRIPMVETVDDGTLRDATQEFTAALEKGAKKKVGAL